MNKNARIYVAGHAGLVGSSIVRLLEGEGHTGLITRTSRELDLRRQEQAESFFARERPEYVFLCAARVGGIGANSAFPAQFIYDNISIAANLIEAARRYGVKKLVNLGSSCIYPRMAPQPLREEALLTGPLEPTNEAYAVAKIAAIKLCRHYHTQYGCDFISAMPTNLYGPHDNFDMETSHVLPAVMRKMHEAKENGAPSVTLWGDGTPLREFLYVDDLAEALVFLMDHVSADDLERAGATDLFLNVGTGNDLTIAELGRAVRKIVGYPGDIVWDSSRPNGTPRKLMDVSRLASLGWKAHTALEDGLRRTYAWFCADRDRSGRRS